MRAPTKKRQVPAKKRLGLPKGITTRHLDRALFSKRLVEVGEHSLSVEPESGRVSIRTAEKKQSFISTTKGWKKVV